MDYKDLKVGMILTLLEDSPIVSVYYIETLGISTLTKGTQFKVVKVEPEDEDFGLMIIVNGVPFLNLAGTDYCEWYDKRYARLFAETKSKHSIALSAIKRLTN
jgi:hypothetical protein